MSNFKKFAAVLLAGAMLAGCSNGGNKPSGGSGEQGGEEGGSASTKPLVVGYDSFNSKFSPFFAETAYDQDVQGMTQISLMSSDRTGALIYNGIDGETIAYNGTDYKYYGPANVKATENADGSVDYAIELRKDIKYSDGDAMTIDDVIFNMYVLADPTYDGSSSFFSLPIEGMEAYRSGMSSLLDLIVAAGRDNTDFTYFTEDQQKAFWASIDKAGEALVKDICAYVVAAGYNAETDDISAKLANWGFEVAEGATEADAYKVIEAAYKGDVINLFATETAGPSLADYMGDDYGQYLTGIKTGESAANIAGIKKVDDYNMTIHMTKVDAPAVYQLAVTIAPMHYYGETAKYDYDKNMFGFDKGDLSHVRSVTTKPMGAGPYKFLQFENGTVNFEANDTYYLGAPKTKYINFLETNAPDKLNGVVQGTIDISDPSFSKTMAKNIADENGNGELNGPKVTTSLVNNLGYGYLGIDADVVNINGEKGSDASKNARKGLATIFALYRDVAVNSYYGDAASVINYPISNTSWAAPQATDPGYKVAFSTDVAGNPIYTTGMTDDEKKEAAKKAALGFFEAAGFTVADGKVTAAPAGWKLTGKESPIELEAWIPADGTGDHPSFMLLTEAKNVFAEMGINLIIKDLSNSSDLWNALEANQVPVWCAAWGATVDPDMTQIYFADVANGGANKGGSNYMYGIEDKELDELIVTARASADQAYRKTVYKAALDIVVDWACEIPVYQRQNCIIFSTERVNMDTVTPDITTFYGWMSEIQNIELK